jgi:3,4-dihydroxy 2-butanone 4-phosphate synthase
MHLFNEWIKRKGMLLPFPPPIRLRPEMFIACWFNSEERFMHQFYLPITSDNSEARLKRTLDAMRAGRLVVLMDDFDRENEADLILAAETLTLETMATLIRDCSGIVCLCLPDETLQRLALPPMVSTNESKNQTAFTVSIEARHGVSTGVSAQDRLTTIQTAIHPHATPHDLVRPGHVFPLRGAPGGVLQRRGHTEGSIDLAIMAGLAPAAVLCELMLPDGRMARFEEAQRYAEMHDLPMLTIEELVQIKARLAEQAA